MRRPPMRASCTGPACVHGQLQGLSGATGRLLLPLQQSARLPQAVAVHRTARGYRQRYAAGSARCSVQEVQPVERSVRAFAPATVANLGVGFDWLGCAVGEKACSLRRITRGQHHNPSIAN